MYQKPDNTLGTCVLIICVVVIAAVIIWGPDTLYKYDPYAYRDLLRTALGMP